MNSTFNKDLFYLYLSNSMVAFPAFRKFTEKLYETQKCRFYSLYYKVIDVLRRNKIKFDYLGKYINQNLLEQEIAEVLKNI